jgi:hypothetical protein
MTEDRGTKNLSPRAPLAIFAALLTALAGAMLLLSTPSAQAPGATGLSAPEASPATEAAVPRGALEAAGARRSPPNASRVDAGPQREASQVPLGLFARLKLSPEQDRLLWQAEESAVADCMRERGFEYSPNPYGRGVEAGAAAREELKPGDVDAARARGFGLAESAEAAQRPPPDANRGSVEKMEPSAQRAWHEALEGPPIEPTGPADRLGIGTVSIPDGPMVQWNRGACLAQAQRFLHGDDLRHTELVMRVDHLRMEADEKARETPEYRAGVVRWRACMAERGFSYSEPNAAADALAREFQSGRLALEELRKREVEVATAEAGCHAEAGLTAVYEGALARAEAEVEQGNRGLLETFLQDQAEALARASKLASR